MFQCVAFICENVGSFLLLLSRRMLDIILVILLYIRMLPSYISFKLQQNNSLHTIRIKICLNFFKRNARK